MDAYAFVPERRLVARHFRRITAILLVLGFILSSCGGNPTGTPTLAIEESIGIIVETAMAATRTAQASITPTSTSTSSTTPSPTSSATPTLTPIPPTLTPEIVYPTWRCQDSEFVKDVTIPDGTVLSPGQVFVKTWKFLNTGTCAWNSRYSIIFLRGDRMRGSDATIGRSVEVNKRLEISVDMVAPSKPGRYHAHWQLADRYGYPFGDVVTVEIVVANPTPTFTPSPALDRGSLQILTSLGNPDAATVPASFKVFYNCGTGYIGQVSVAPAGSAIVAGIPTGSTCSVTEVPPDPISGYTWGAITYTPASVVISAKNQSYAITVGNSITRDRGSLQILKTLNNPDGAAVAAGFAVNYNCGAGYAGQVSVAPGNPATISGIPTGSICSVTETAPDPIAGYTWGMVTYTPASVVIGAKDQVHTITVGNSITLDHGSLQIIKTLNNPDGATVPAEFTIDYNCGTGYTGQLNVIPGSPATVAGIPYGRTCTVTEVAPDPIPGYLWGAAAYTPDAVVINARDQIFTINVENSITLDPGFKPAPPSPRDDD